MQGLTVTALLASVLAAPIDVKRVDIHVDGKRPIAGERSRFAVSPAGEIVFTYTLVAGKPTYLPFGIIGSDGQIRLDAIESETTWNVEGWGLHGWPFDLAFAGPGDLRYAVRFHGKPYGVDYWHKVDGVWQLETFGQNVTYGGNNVALGILPDKRPVVLSVAVNRSRLCVWERSLEGRWSRSEPAELSGVAGGDFDLGVLRDGSLLLVFCPAKGGPVCATRVRDGTWRRGVIDTINSSMMVTLAMDHQGQAHVAYGAGPSRELRYAVQHDGEWRIRSVAEASEGRHVGRTDIAVAAGRAAIVWEMGTGIRFAPKDYGGGVGGVMLTVVDAAGKARTHELVKENAGRPSIALAPDGKAAYVGVYTGNGHGDDFYLLVCGLDGNPAPDLRRPQEQPEDVFVKGCLNEIHSGNTPAEKRGMSRIDMSKLDPEQSIALIERFLSSDDFILRADAARELARSPEALSQLARRLSQVLNDPNRLVRHRFLAHLDLSGGSMSTVVPYLVGCLKSTDATSRLAAVEAIVKCRELLDEAKFGEAVAALADDLGSRDRVRSGSAGMALEYLADLPAVEAIVRQRLDSAAALTKAHAALTLWRMNKPFDVARLADVPESDDEAAGLALCGLLAQVRSRDCVPLLTASLSNRSPAVRASAVAALRSIALVAELKPVAKHPKGMDLLALRVTGKGKPVELAARAEASEALVAALKHRDANVREKACDALGRVVAKVNTADIEGLLTDPDAGVRSAAKTAIGVLRGSQPAEFLMDVATWRRQAENRRACRVGNVTRRPTQMQDEIVLAGSDKQLLIDDFVIEEARGLQRKLHTFKKHPRNPVLQAQVPWEEGWVDPFMSTVLYDEKERAFKLWYRCGPRHSLTGYAVSEDGIHWVRPNIAAAPWQELEHHNLVGFEGKVGIWKCPGRNVIHRPDLADAGKRYSSFFFRHDKNYVVSYSGDGITWTQPEVARRAFGDVVSIVWDPARERYLLFPKYMTRKDGLVRRSFAAFEIRSIEEPGSRVLPFLASHRDDAQVADGASRAFGSLLADVLRVPQFHSQIYSVTAMPYEGVVVALYDFWTLIGSNEGPLDMLMKVSRDMKTWEDVDFPTRALEIGRFGEWDSGMVYGANTMLVVDDEIRLYYLGANMGHCTRALPMTRPYHRIGMGLATLRLDGFVSMRAGETEGVLTTKPLTFEGNRLIVNANCPEGCLRVELLGRKGEVIPGFGKDDAEPFAGDSLRHTITWRGIADVSRLAGEPIRIRFLLKGGDLYAFRFGQ